MGPAAVDSHKGGFGWLTNYSKEVVATELQGHKMDKVAMAYLPGGAIVVLLGDHGSVLVATRRPSGRWWLRASRWLGLARKTTKKEHSGRWGNCCPLLGDVASVEPQGPPCCNS